MAKRKSSVPSAVPLTSSVRPAPRIAKRFRTTGEDWSISGTWAGVVSSNVSAIKYESGAKKLHVLMDHGTVYVYGAVESLTARNVYNASSVGKAVHHYFVRTKYPFTTYTGGALNAVFRSLAEN